MAHVDDLLTLPDNDIKNALADLTDEEVNQLFYDWTFWARPNQLPPEGNWSTWLLMAGRGFGKTRVGSEYIRMKVESGEAKRVALISPTPADARDVMIEGESGILSISPEDSKPYYEPSKRRLTWPNGAMATVFSGAHPEQLRGPQFDLVWVDELSSFVYPQNTWDNMQFGLRLGNDPRVVVTTTPKPIPLIKKLVNNKSTHVTTGSTYENKQNLASGFIEQVKTEYEGTKLGRQELYAEILDDTEGALWRLDQIEKLRMKVAPILTRIVVAIDPAVTHDEQSDETGIIVAGRDAKGNGYILEDRSLKSSPDEWAQAAVDAYHYWGADRIIGENNQGGDMVESVIRTKDRKVAYTGVHATRGKKTRAEPVAALYEQGKVFHIGNLSGLEDQMTTWVPHIANHSPDRVDALVWALWNLIIKTKGKKKIKASSI